MINLLLICLFQTIEYEVGDVLEILPGQSPEAIDAFIKRCNLNPESYIIVSIVSIYQSYSCASYAFILLVTCSLFYKLFQHMDANLKPFKFWHVP